MSNRLFQGLVYQMRDTIDRMIGVIDESATIIACSDLTKIGEPNDFLAVDLGENSEALVYIEDENADVSALSDDVKKACDGLPPYKRVSKVERRSEPFEKTTTNKIKRTPD